MKLSERGALRAALADGRYAVYPAGRLLELVTKTLGGDALRDDFEPERTVAKLEKARGELSGAGAEVVLADLAQLAERVATLPVSYDIDAVFDAMMAAVDAMAKRYYGVEGIVVPRPRVVEYYFEGFSELYRDGDWFAFNVSQAESLELGVPVGTFFKRSQVSPGQAEFTAFHEANHVMQEAAMLPEGVHQYVPWLDEGLADALGRLMLLRATKDEQLLGRVRAFRTEIEVTDPRKVTYHHGEQTALLLLLQGGLPLCKSLMRVRRAEPFSVDWAALARQLRAGAEPRAAVSEAAQADARVRVKSFLAHGEERFRGLGELDDLDRKAIRAFLGTQPPACIPAAEYEAARWLAAQLEGERGRLWLDPAAVPEAERAKVDGWREDAPLRPAAVPAELWQKAPALELKLLVARDDVPAAMREAADKLGAQYFVIKRQIGQTLVYEPHGGGLPCRLATGEVRCALP